jgi:phage FluMu gp28-like protein
LLKLINRVRGTRLSEEQFLADCKSRSRLEEVYEQTYLCNPAPSADGIVEWSAIEHCRADYEIPRVHLEADQIRNQFGEYRPELQFDRARRIREFIHNRFLPLFQDYKGKEHVLGFDVAASGEGDLMVIYIDEKKGSELWLRALFTCRTEDWDFIKTVLFAFMEELRYVQAAGDETGLGRQICWEATKAFPGRFTAVNFASRKHDIGFALMNQLATLQKRFPRSEQDIATDYLALRKSFHGNRWIFSEGTNTANPASHCDIAWAGALATHAHTDNKGSIGCAVLMEDGTVLHSDRPLSREQELILSEDPRIWRPFR